MTNQSEFVLVRWTALFLSAVLFAILFPTLDSASDVLQSPANVSCACPGEVLTFICIINEGGTTLWTGTAFSCNLNEILLRHSQFSLPGGTSGSCNNGAITGQSIGVTNGCYSSELDVTVSPDFNGRTILCNHDGTTQRNIGASTLNVVTAMDPPSSVELTGIQNRQAQFRWTPIDSCTPVVRYSIATNCSSQCSPMTTNQTTTSCTVSEPTTDVVVCDFGIQSVVCGNLMGDFHTAVITLQARAASVNLIPHYSTDDKSFSKFTILGTNLTIALSDDTPIFIREYRVSYIDPTTGRVLHSTTVSSCGSDTCDTDVILPSVSVCLPSASTVDIAIMADTGFGPRPLSDPISTACKNQFVDVQYNFSSSTFTCTFLNQMDTSIKYCSIVYRDCNQQQTKSARANSTPGAPNTVTLSVMSSNGSVCYSAEASNGSFTLVVEGRVQSTMTENVGNTAAVIAIAVLIPGIIIIIMIIAAVVVVILYRQNMRKGAVGQRGYIGLQQMSIIDRLKLELIDEKVRKFRKHKVQSNCNLKDAIDFQMKVPFKRGRVYYEFTHEIENISEEKELIFMEKDTGKYYTPTAESSVLRQCGVIGKDLKRQIFKNYRMFVQSTGSGTRHLAIDSIILYEHKQDNEWKPEDAPLMPITSSDFVISEVPHDCTIEHFCKEKKLDPSRHNSSILLEFNKIDKSNIVKGGIRDVILMEKKDRTLFTGPIARSDDPSIHEKTWRIFVMAYFDDKTPLKAGSLTIHQNPERLKAHFYVLQVDEDNVLMSDFVKRALGMTKYENGRAYYEFTLTEEDLVSYKEVVRMHKSVAKKYKDEQKEEKSVGEPSNKKNQEKELLEVGIKWFYWIGAPGIGIKPKRYEDYLVFIQSTSQGSRCLKSKTLLLYKVQ